MELAIGKLFGFLGRILSSSKVPEEEPIIIERWVARATHLRIQNKLKSIKAAERSTVRIRASEGVKIKITVKLYSSELSETAIKDIKDDLKEKKHTGKSKK